MPTTMNRLATQCKPEPTFASKSQVNRTLRHSLTVGWLTLNRKAGHHVPMSETYTLTEKVAEEIRALLGRRRMSGRQLASTLAVSQTWVSSRLSGSTPIDLNDLDRIAAALNVDVADLLPRRNEGHLIAVAGRSGSNPPKLNIENPGSAKRPRPNGHPSRTSPHPSTRRPGRTLMAHAFS